ncbi:hypothetical protein BK666_09115 [Pseudomonas frederiksbergensis]|uniref:Phage antirepressor protein n=1 Tax=Pseudomonas frederiksbergensis TaxID=104087 RepID=A0A423K9K1_9PSED|nr:phage antirepressor protein [Pseudomonas frederiksbergensis]RON48573.1 hypothetical protein BK666_09115 [Pseudomonas frederiksbergensis]
MTSVPSKGGDAVTMISLELVDFINSRRTEGAPTLGHNDFLKKVPRVLKKDAGKFSHIYLDSMNRRQKCYRLHKRECCLMAMSYSYELQAAVLDHMSELELRLAQRAAFPIPQTRADALRLAADLDEHNARLLLENRDLRLGLETPEPSFQVGLTPVQFCRTLNGVNSQKINHFLLESGWIYNAETDPDRAPKYRTRSRARDNYLAEDVRSIARPGQKPILTYSLTLLLAGSSRLHEWYLEQKLPMKSSWDGSLMQRWSYREDLR